MPALARVTAHQDDPGPPPERVEVDRTEWYKELPILRVVDACVGTRNTLVGEGHDVPGSERIGSIEAALRSARANPDWSKRPAHWNGCP